MIQTFASLEAIERHYSSFPYHQVTSTEAQDSFYKKQKQEKNEAIKRLNTLGSRRCKIIADLQSISGMASAHAYKISSSPDCVEIEIENFKKIKERLSRIMNQLDIFEDDFMFADLPI